MPGLAEEAPQAYKNISRVVETVSKDVTSSFLVPLYPLTPLFFCATCVYMRQASLTYTGIGALVGVGVLLSGVPLLFIARH